MYTFWITLLSVFCSSYGVDYSWRMLGGNVQRNSRADFQNSTLKNPSVTWIFPVQNARDAFIHSPVYSYPDEAVYTSSFQGFLYSVNAKTGEMNWEYCLGKPPVFPSDPCTDLSLLTQLPYGQPTILSSGDIIVLTQSTYGTDRMKRISKKDGSEVWTLQLYRNENTGSGDHFYSLPTPIPCNNTVVRGTECILIWITRYKQVVYTIINADNGKIELQRNWTGHDATYSNPPMVIDPLDGKVISEYMDVQKSCGINYDQEMRCVGVGKFETWTGEKLWNQTMETSWSNGMMTVDRGIIHAPGIQLWAYSYNSKDGSIRWKIEETASSNNIMYPGICSNGTVVYPDRLHYLSGWTTELVRNKKPLFVTSCDCKGISIIPSMTNDGSFYLIEDNSVIARSCKDGSELWHMDFGSGDSFTNPVAIGKDCIYASLYIPKGALVKLEDRK